MRRSRQVTLAIWRNGASCTRAPLDTPLMPSFVTQLKDINALAERSPCFVWRLQSSEGDAAGRNSRVR
ncbi:DUF3291 domain-containing protein [Burkholderia multivorans]|uniref:DUF3291 domain-containing protein n=1 Tax=Burkholderia ubonensis TaxID=101571 RepID=UPI000F6CA182|nr:DUF3291 domain-containing protein [Burkholderia ubonensis]AYZ63105.1 DUF3291 domain-containing protein [Burkholderia multivorans]